MDVEGMTEVFETDVEGNGVTEDAVEDEGSFKLGSGMDSIATTSSRLVENEDRAMSTEG